MNLTGAPRLARRDTLDYCAAAAVHLLREREARYPALVEAHKLSPNAAAAHLEAARCLVAQWRWTINPARPPLPRFDEWAGRFGSHNYILAAEIRDAARRQCTLAERDPQDADAVELADLYDALAWWQHDVAGLARIVFWIDLERSTNPAAERRQAA